MNFAFVLSDILNQSITALVFFQRLRLVFVVRCETRFISLHFCRVYESTFRVVLKAWFMVFKRDETIFWCIL